MTAAQFTQITKQRSIVHVDEVPNDTIREQDRESMSPPKFSMRDLQQPVEVYFKRTDKSHMRQNSEHLYNMPFLQQQAREEASVRVRSSLD